MFSGIMGSMVGAVELGLLFALMAIGVFITFRILNFPDLTVDGSFATGGAVTAVLITHGYSPWLSIAAAFASGLAAGACTGLLHTKGKINGLLSGILMMIALYSINMRIMGKPLISISRSDTMFAAIAGNKYVIIALLVLGVFIIKLLFDAFLHTDLGLALRATGDNPRMIRSLGASTDATIIFGVSLSNGLVAASGSLVTQQAFGYADISMGVGLIVIGLASVIIGEALFGARTVFRATLAVILGSIVYRMVVALALRIPWLDASDLRLITAVIVIIALIFPTIRRNLSQRELARKRTIELMRQPAAASSTATTSTVTSANEEGGAS